MGLLDFVEKIKEKEAIEVETVKRIEANPRFAGMNAKKIEFHPIDGSEDRMKLYGCYKDDSFTYEGKTYVVEKDDVERIEIHPVEEAFWDRRGLGLSRLDKKRKRKISLLEREEFY